MFLFQAAQPVLLTVINGSYGAQADLGQRERRRPCRCGEEWKRASLKGRIGLRRPAGEKLQSGVCAENFQECRNRPRAKA